jgi:hypothetical protein
MGGISPTGPQEVETKMERDDKSLRCICAFTTTDQNGQAEFCIPIPSDDRYIAYGDAEFEVREFGDYVAVIELTDLDRVLAQGAADEQMKEMFPLYPVVAHYDERGFPDPMPVNSKGTIMGGVAMTFQFGETVVEPIGGYGHMYGGLYLRIVVQKATRAAGQKCQISVDWAEMTP